MYGGVLYQIDDLDVHDGVNYLCQIPELDNYFGPTLMLTPMQARTPAFNRQQPIEGKYTCLFHILHPLSADYQTRRVALESRLGPGVHTLRVKARGMSAAKSVLVYFDGGLTIDEPVTGRSTAKAVAPDPTWI